MTVQAGCLVRNFKAILELMKTCRSVINNDHDLIPFVLWELKSVMALVHDPDVFTIYILPGNFVIDRFPVGSF